MTWALTLSALLMGLAGSWHCAVMCGATSAAVQRACSRGGRSAPAWWGFQLGRLLGYALAGAAVAASVAVLAQIGQWSPVLRPIWALAHAAALSLGLWLLWSGRQPAWLAQLGRGGAPAAPVRPAAGGWQALQGPLSAAAAGSAWFAWPCGLLQGALMLAALASGPAQGALVMAAFGLGSTAGLGALPLWRAWCGREGKPGRAGVDRSPLLMRAAGAALAAGSGWALGHGLWATLKAFCL